MSTPIPLAKGTYRAFPSIQPRKAHRREYSFRNDGEERWTSLTITTGPQAFGGSVNAALGGTGDPPGLQGFLIRTPRQTSTGGGDATENVRVAFQPVERNQVVRAAIRAAVEAGRVAPEEAHRKLETIERQLAGAERAREKREAHTAESTR